MSLRVDHARSRGRSRSPGRRDDRSRSRDIRAPSPVIVQAKKSSKKYYSDESDSDTRSRRKSARKYRDDSESDSDTLSRRKCSKKYPDDSESDSVTLLRKSSKPYRDGSESDSDPRSKGASINKRYESDDSDSDPVYKRRPSKKDRDGSDPDPKIKGKSSRKRYTDSDSDSMTKKKSSRKHFDHGGSSLSSSDENRKTRHKGVYIETATSNYEHERHNSYAPEHKPVDYNRHMSNRMVEEDEMYRQSYRQSSKPGGFGEGHSSHPQYASLSPRPISFCA